MSSRGKNRGFRAILAFVLLTAGCVSRPVESRELEARPTGTPLPQSWAPAAPQADDFDWIQLKSGEWLKGKLESLQEDKLEFDSEELELLEFDWEDVDEVRSSRVCSVRLDDGTTVAGSLLVTRHTVTIRGRDEWIYERSRLLAIAPAGERERDYWSGKVSMGVTLRSGNSDQSEANIRANLKRRTTATRLALDYLANLATLDGDETANNHRVTAEYDTWLSRRFFVRVPFVEYLRDTFSNIDGRFTVGGGAGYYLLYGRNTEWSVFAGPGYGFTKFVSVETGEEEKEDNFALLLDSRLETELTKRIDFLLEHRSQLARQEAAGSTFHSVATLEVELTQLLELDLSFVWDRVSDPAPDENGEVPERDDFRLALTLGLDF